MKKKTKNQPHIENAPLLPEPKYIISTIDQLLGISFNSKYKTLDLQEYETQINGYNASELSDHALTLNIKDQGDRPRLLKALLDEFVTYTRPLRTVEGIKPPEQKTFGADIYKIMSAGK